MRIYHIESGVVLQDDNIYFSGDDVIYHGEIIGKIDVDYYELAEQENDNGN